MWPRRLLSASLDAYYIFGEPARSKLALWPVFFYFILSLSAKTQFNYSS